MGVDSLQLIHNGTDILYTFRNFYAHSSLNTHAQCMAVLLCTEVVESVCQCQCLRVSETFAHFLNTSVYVSAVSIQLFDILAFQRYTKTQNSMCCGVLRSYVHHIFAVIEDNIFFVLYATVGVQFQFGGGIYRFFVIHS
ncbi:hypothetical protein SDC9_170884 [bioreactor metagenome]|uniref:Uncharacterized protein n=1 Tax=bioreactor metagenome TaxID=1076179 RepID=A0A645GBK2_9ZZZZ